MEANRTGMKFLICALLLLTSCFSRNAMMTYSQYDGIQSGMTVSDLKSEVGEPYAIRNTGDGIQEYEYIERIDTGNNIAAENHYFIVIKDGKVIGKRMKREGPPAYDLIYQTEPNYPNY